MTSCWILNGSIVVIIWVGSFLPDGTIGVGLCPQTSQSFGQSETFDWPIWSQILDQSFAVFFVLRRILYQQKKGYTELCSLPKEVVEIQKFYCHLYVSLSVSGGTWLKIILENMVQWCDVEARQSRDQEEMVQKEDLVAQLLQLVVWTTKC